MNYVQDKENLEIFILIYLSYSNFHPKGDFPSVQKYKSSNFAMKTHGDLQHSQRKVFQRGLSNNSK